MILDTLAAAAKARVAKLEKQKSLVTVRAEAEQVYHRETCAAISLKYTSDPRKYSGSVRTEMAAAPPLS